MYKLIFTLHDAEKALKFISETDKIISSVNFEKLFVYSHNSPNDKVLDLLSSYKYLLRNNIGRDYGAFYDAFYSEVNEDIKYFGFIHDDVTFVKYDFLNYIDELFKKDDKIDIVSPQLALNKNGEIIPRGSLWFARRSFLNILQWKKPVDDSDAYYQEMNLLPSTLRMNRSKIAQCGNGHDIMYPDKYGPERPDTITNRTEIFNY